MSTVASRAARLAAICALSMFLAAGCGGSSPDKSGSSGGPGKASSRQSLLGSAATAGVAKAYTPSGKIVANSGFRPTVDGFGFENYGNDARPVNLTPGNVENLFGPQVCVTGTGASCMLTPPAKYWMRRVNATMAGGTAWASPSAPCDSSPRTSPRSLTERAIRSRSRSRRTSLCSH